MNAFYYSKNIAISIAYIISFIEKTEYSFETITIGEEKFALLMKKELWEQFKKLPSKTLRDVKINLYLLNQNGYQLCLNTSVPITPIVFQTKFPYIYTFLMSQNAYMLESLPASSIIKNFFIPLCLETTTHQNVK